MKRELVKVQFYDPDIGYENLWASQLSKGRYRIESIPFFIYGVSRGDIVIASTDNEGRLKFHKVIERSTNRTLRARSDRLVKNSRRRKKIITDLEKLGSDVEELRSRLLAINVPSKVDLQQVVDYLTRDAKISWEYGNPASLNKE